MIVGKVIFRSHSHFKCRLLSFFVRGNSFMKFLVFKFKPAQIESVFCLAKSHLPVKFKQVKFAPSARTLQ